MAREVSGKSCSCIEEISSPAGVQTCAFPFRQPVIILGRYVKERFKKRLKGMKNYFDAWEVIAKTASSCGKVCSFVGCWKCGKKNSMSSSCSAVR